MDDEADPSRRKRTVAVVKRSGAPFVRPEARKEAIMKVQVRRLAFVFAVALIQGLGVAPSLAAGHVRPHRAPEYSDQQYGYDQYGYGYAPGNYAPGYAAVPRTAPGGCYTDEGQGRFAPCDVGGP
jgi:hypothetical protein